MVLFICSKGALGPVRVSVVCWKRFASDSSISRLNIPRSSALHLFVDFSLRETTIQCGSALRNKGQKDGKEKQKSERSSGHSPAHGAMGGGNPRQGR